MSSRKCQQHFIDRNSRNTKKYDVNKCVTQHKFQIIMGKPLNTADPMTVTTVAKLIAVKILFNILDSFTPVDSKMARAIIIKNAQKSRYGAKNGTSIGNNS